MVKLFETTAGQTLLNIRCNMMYQERQQARQEVRAKVCACNGRKGGKATAARREMARLASIGIRPVKG